jgi:hypothetical protein
MPVTIKVTKDYYLMSFQTLASIDLNACTKAQLKAFVKLARDEWGRAIDLRSANVHDLIEYLTMYLAHKAATEATEPEVEPVTLNPLYCNHWDDRNSKSCDTLLSFIRKKSRFTKLDNCRHTGTIWACRTPRTRKTSRPTDAAHVLHLVAVFKTRAEAESVATSELRDH